MRCFLFPGERDASFSISCLRRAYSFRAALSRCQRMKGSKMWAIVRIHPSEFSTMNVPTPVAISPRSIREIKIAGRVYLLAGRAQSPSATHPEGIMLHGEVAYAVVFSGTGFASDAVGVALESGGYSRRTPTGALHHHPRDGAQRLAAGAGGCPARASSDRGRLSR